MELLGRGWAFPIRPDASGRLDYADGEAHIRDSIWLILATAPGERVMRPDFGCGIHDYVFQANTPALRGLIETRTREALVRWEPRIDVLDVSVDSLVDAPERLFIDVSYRIRANNALFNLVYPFFLLEGAR